MHLKIVALAIALGTPSFGNSVLAADDLTFAAPGKSIGAQDDGTVRVPAFELPLSSFLTQEAQDATRWRQRLWNDLVRECSFKSGTGEDVLATRRCLDKLFGRFLEKQRARYAVNIQLETIGGIPTEVITPADGVSRENHHNVLINVHGGAFMHGARVVSQIESIPMAAVGRITVVSVDYRMAPEYRFPAASEDVAAVYRALLRRYKPERIGIYGCSAGALLTAQAVSWFQKEGLPRPGAVGMFCTGASLWGEGDSGYFAAAILGVSPQPRNHPSFDGIAYLQGTSATDPLVIPLTASRVLAKFPPSLLITSTRDVGLSSVVQTHAELVKKGVAAELHVWDGLDHAFFYDPDAPQSLEVYDIAAKFFAKHLRK